jgi:hypothetical protein
LGEVSIISSLLGCLRWSKIRIQKPFGDVRQHHFYDGWTHDHYTANLFLFTTDGRICAAYLNSPGTTHDLTIATMSKTYHMIDFIYDRMDRMAKVVVASTFASEEWDS